MVPKAPELYDTSCSVLLHPPAKCTEVGKRATVQLVYNVANSWMNGRIAHTDKFTPGDIYCTGHASHGDGYNADIYAQNNRLFQYKAITITGTDHQTKNPKYSRAVTEQLAEEFLKTGAVNYILYSDKTVVTEVNKYAKAHKLFGRMQYQ